MFYLFITTYFFSNFLIKFKTGKLINPFFFFSSFWIFWILISIINPFNLFTVSQTTYFLIFLSIFSFFLAYFIFAKKVTKSIETISDKFQLYQVISPKKILFLQIILLIILVLYFFKYQNLLESLGVSFSRTIKFELGYLFSSYFEVIFFNWFITAGVYFLGIYNTVIFILFKKNKLNIMISGINILLLAAIGQGRKSIVDFIIYFLLIFIFYICFFIQQKKQKIKLKYLLPIFPAMYIVTNIYAQRIGVILNFNNFAKIFFDSLEQGVIYFTGPFVALDTFLKNYSLMNLPFYFFKATFSGITEFIEVPYTILGISFQSGADIIGNLTQESIPIGFNSFDFNALYTGIFNFYIDAGVVGVILFSFFAGCATVYVFNRFNQRKNIFTIMLLVYITWMSIISIYKLPSHPDNVLVLLLIFSLNFFFLKDTNNKSSKGIAYEKNN